MYEGWWFYSWSWDSFFSIFGDNKDCKAVQTKYEKSYVVLLRHYREKLDSTMLWCDRNKFNAKAQNWCDTGIVNIQTNGGFKSGVVPPSHEKREANILENEKASSSAIGGYKRAH